MRCLIDEERFPRGWPSVLVSVADRHVAQEFMTIDERLDDMIARHELHRASIESARRPAHRLEYDVADAAGVSVAQLVNALRDAWGADPVVSELRAIPAQAVPGPDGPTASLRT